MYEAFYDTELVSIFLPRSLTRINGYAFAHTLFLRCVEFPSGSNLEEINFSAFFESNIDNFTVPSSVYELGEDAFASSKLKDITFKPSSVELDIQARCFKESLIEKILIPNNIKYLKNSVFENCKKLKEVTFDYDIQLLKIGKQCFKQCTAITEIVIPDSIMYIENAPFLVNYVNL